MEICSTMFNSCLSANLGINKKYNKKGKQKTLIDNQCKDNLEVKVALLYCEIHYLSHIAVCLNMPKGSSIFVDFLQFLQWQSSQPPQPMDNSSQVENPYLVLD